jgi:hypothetical protein
MKIENTSDLFRYGRLAFCGQLAGYYGFHIRMAFPWVFNLPDLYYVITVLQAFYFVNIGTQNKPVQKIGSFYISLFNGNKV